MNHFLSLSLNHIFVQHNNTARCHADQCFLHAQGGEPWLGVWVFFSDSVLMVHIFFLKWKEIEFLFKICSSWTGERCLSSESVCHMNKNVRVRIPLGPHVNALSGYRDIYGTQFEQKSKNNFF